MSESKDLRPYILRQTVDGVNRFLSHRGWQPDIRWAVRYEKAEADHRLTTFGVSAHPLRIKLSPDDKAFRDVHRQLVAAEEKWESWMKRHDAVVVERDALKIRVEAVTNERGDLRVELAEVTRQSDAWKSDAAAKHRVNLDVIRDRDAALGKVRELQYQVPQANSMNNEQAKTIADLKERLAGVIAHRDSFIQLAADRWKELLAFEAKLASVTKERDAWKKSALSQADTLAEKVETANAATLTKLAAAESEVVRYRGLFHETVRNRDDLSSKLSATEGLLKECGAHAGRLEAELAATKHNAQWRVHPTYAGMVQEMDRAKGFQVAAEDRANDYAVRLNAVTKERDEALDKLHYQRAEWESLVEPRNRWRVREAGLNAKIASLEADYSTLTKAWAEEVEPKCRAIHLANVAHENLALARLSLTAARGMREEANAKVARLEALALFSVGATERQAIISIVARIAEQACRNGEAGDRVWIPLADITFKESWRVVGEKYVDQVAAVLAVARDGTKGERS